MTLANPHPRIPALGADNSIDLDALGNEPLETWVTFPGLGFGSSAFANWRGCSANNEVVDFLQRETFLSVTDGWARMNIPNTVLRALDGGHVFYSFNMRTPEGERGEESLRKFFYVNRTSEDTQALPIAQVRSCHDQTLYEALLDPSGVQVVAPAYLSMGDGDRVRLRWEGFLDDGMGLGPVERVIDIREQDVGRPVRWSLEYTEVVIADYGRLSYVIEHASGEMTEAPEQRLNIVLGELPQLPLLPPPVIRGHNGGALDPGQFPDGFVVSIEPYPNMQAGDAVVLYAQGATLGLYALRTDLTSVDGQRVELKVDARWIAENAGQVISFSYQFSRLGVALSSQPLDVLLRAPLHLPQPVVRNAVPAPGDAPNQGTVHPRDLRDGSSVSIPGDAVIDGGDVRMHWEGFGASGSVVVEDHSIGDERRYLIPASAVPANIGKRLNVYYSVTPPGESAHYSQIFDLRIDDFASSAFPTIQGDDVRNFQLSLARVPAGGTRFVLDSWPFMAEGQQLSIKVSGVPQGDAESEYVLRDPATPVSEDEYYDGELEMLIPKAFLQGLQLNQQFRLTVEASFDGAHSFKAFPSVSIQLIQ